MPMKYYLMRNLNEQNYGIKEKEKEFLFSFLRSFSIKIIKLFLIHLR